MPAFSVPDNLAFDSYGDLATAIQDWMDRSDLSGSVQAMIALAETRMKRKLDPLFSEQSASVTTVSGFGALPTDCRTVNRVLYNGRTVSLNAPSAAPSAPSDYSEPLAYTLEAGQLRLWPAGDWVVTVLYQPMLTSLSEANPTNALLSRHPDAYFFGAMVFAEGYVANDQRAATFKALWDECLEEMKVFFTRQRFAGPLVPRVAYVP